MMAVYWHMSQTPFGLLTDWDYQNQPEFAESDFSSQTPFGLLTDWDAISSSAPRSSNPRKSQTPFGLLTDWDLMWWGLYLA